MKFQDISNPCYCISLKCGVIVIGSLDIILGFLSIAFVGYDLGTKYYSSSNPNSSGAITPANNVTAIHSSESTTNSPSSSAGVADPDNQLFWVCTVLIMFMVFCVLTIIFGTILIIGAKRDKILLLKGWLVFTSSGVLFRLGIFIAFFFLQESATIKPSIIDFISMLFGIYCLWVVYALMIQVKKAQSIGPVKPRL